jgi:hypothetical protein
VDLSLIGIVSAIGMSHRDIELDWTSEGNGASVRVCAVLPQSLFNLSRLNP